MADRSANSVKVDESGNNYIKIKVGMIGESQAGKTSLMVKYIEDKFDEDYIETLGVNFMEKTIQLRNITVTLSVWEFGTQKEYSNFMPLVCRDAKVFLFVFDLTRKLSLYMIRDWYKWARKQSKYASPFLIGSKFDLFDKKDMKFKEEITTLARKFSKAMKAPLIYCSSSHSINIKNLFQLILAKVFHLRPKVAEIKNISEPLVEYKATWKKKKNSKKSGQKRKEDR